MLGLTLKSREIEVRASRVRCALTGSYRPTFNHSFCIFSRNARLCFSIDCSRSFSEACKLSDCECVIRRATSDRIKRMKVAGCMESSLLFHLGPPRHPSTFLPDTRPQAVVAYERHLTSHTSSRQVAHASGASCGSDCFDNHSLGACHSLPYPSLTTLKLEHTPLSMPLHRASRSLFFSP